MARTMAADAANLARTSEALRAYDEVYGRCQDVALGVSTRRGLVEALTEAERAGAHLRQALLLDSGVRLGSDRILRVEVRRLRSVVERWRKDEPVTWKDVEDAVL